MNRLLFVSTVMALPITASAQQRDASGWGIGAGVAAIDSPYAGEDIRLRPIPLLSWRGDFGEVQYRAGDVVGAQTGGALERLGLAMGGLVSVVVPLALVWAALGFWLGGAQARRAVSP